MVPALADRAGVRPDEPGFRDLRPRVLSAAVLLPTALVCIWAGGVPWFAMVAVAAALLAWEWARLCGRAPHRAAWRAFGALYIGATVVGLLLLRADAAVGRGDTLFLFAIVWASDIGAYGAGRAFGGPRLAPAISPGKTWSGAAGGLLSAMAAGAAAAYVVDGALHAPVPVLAVAATLGLLAQAGDLFESWLKRRFDVKDTSTLIPGHGGILDRLDGLLAAAPVAALIGAAQGSGRALWA